MNKMTYADALSRAIYLLGENAENDDVVNRLNALKMTLEKRALKAKTAERKPSKAAQENAKVRAEIVGWMKQNMTEPLCSDEIAKGMGIDVHKVRALLGRCDEVEKVKVSARLNKWKVREQA